MVVVGEFLSPTGTCPTQRADYSKRVAVEQPLLWGTVRPQKLPFFCGRSAWNIPADRQSCWNRNLGKRGAGRRAAARRRAKVAFFFVDRMS